MNKPNKENFENVFQKLVEEDKKELDRISKELGTRKTKDNLISDKMLKKRISRLCFRLVDETSNDEELIKDTCNLLTGYFVWYSFGDERDEAFDIASELELPETHVSGDVMKMWMRMKNIFQKLSK
jgi:hypothetical protein